jgi:hypothetical protein
MNTSIILLIIFFILIILGGIGYFIYKSNNKSKVQVPCPQNDISNYNIDEKPLKGSELLQRIFTRVSRFMNRIRESFDLSTGTVTSISSMLPGAKYSRGTLKPGISSTVTAAKNKGTNPCVPYPTTVYFLESVPSPSFILVSKYKDWFSYESYIQRYKDDIGVTDVASATKYALDNGYSAFAFNEKPIPSSDPNINTFNRMILFFREDYITNNFWDSGYLRSGFKTYASPTSKLNTTVLQV